MHKIRGQARSTPPVYRRCMDYTCHVCTRAVEPDPEGKVRLEGVTPDDSKAWVWGPVPVHEDCRLRFKTPFDDRLGAGYTATWQRMTA